MLKKKKEVKPSQQQEIYLSLLNKYEKSLFALGKNDEEVARELAEFIQFYDSFK